MDHLTDLLNHAASADTEAGQARVQEIIAKLREIEDVNLADLETDATARFEELYADGQYQLDQVGTLEALADITDAVRELRTEQQQERDEQDRRVGALADRVRTTAEADATDAEDNDSENTDSDAEPPAGEGTDSDAEPPAGDDASEPDNDAQDDDGTAPAAEQDAGQTPPEPARQPVAASARGSRRPSTATALNAARSKNPARSLKKDPMLRYSITAAAEVPDTPYGKQLTVPDLAEAALARFSSFPVGQQTNGLMKANVARVNREYRGDVLVAGSMEMADAQVIDRIADEKRLPGGSLVAAATKALTAADQAPSVINDVWCSPSETDYTLCPPMATTSGMLDLPTTGLPRRGGIRYPIWDEYPDQEIDPDRNSYHGYVVEYPNNPPTPDGKGLDNPKYFRKGATDADNGAGYPKKCIEGPCVTWAEARMSLAYLCITSDILRDKTYPELAERFMDDVLVHHQHYLNETYINHINERSDKLDDFSVADSIGSAAEAVLDRIPLLVAWFRNAYRMTDTATLEIVAPVWFREFLKRDLERKSNRPHGTVSDAEVQALFASYASRVQWVYDWQDLANSANAGSFSKKIMPAAAWPANVELMAYPAGSWVLFQGNVINLGVQYDYQLLQENRYSAMFTEDAWMLLNRCARSFKLTIKDLCASGAVGPRKDACPNPAAAPVRIQQIAGDGKVYPATVPVPADAGEGTAAADTGTAAAAATTKTAPKK